MKDTDLAYAAGYFDGEGCFAVYNVKNRTGRAHRATVCMVNTNLPVVQWFQNHWGGSVSTIEARGSVKRRAFRWNLRPSGMEQFINDLLPYLREKRPQALLVLEFVGTLGARSDKVPPDVYRRREEICHEIKAMKKVEHAPQEPQRLHG